jgi:hypothetical protein
MIQVLAAADHGHAVGQVAGEDKVGAGSTTARRRDRDLVVPTQAGESTAGFGTWRQDRLESRAHGVRQIDPWPKPCARPPQTS